MLAVVTLGAIVILAVFFAWWENLQERRRDARRNAWTSSAFIAANRDDGPSGPVFGCVRLYGGPFDGIVLHEVPGSFTVPQVSERGANGRPIGWNRVPYTVKFRTAGGVHIAVWNPDADTAAHLHAAAVARTTPTT